MCIIGKWRADSLCACLWDTVPAQHQPEYMGYAIPDMRTHKVLELRSKSSVYDGAEDCIDLVIKGYIHRQWERLENEQPTPTLTPVPNECGECFDHEITRSLRDTRMPAEGVMGIIKTYCGPCRLETDNISSILFDMMGRSSHNKLGF